MANNSALLGPVADHGSIPAHPAPSALAGPLTHCPAGDCLQSPRGGDSVDNPFKTPKFLDVEVDQPARFAVFIAHNRLGGDQIAQPRQAGAAQHPADGGGRDAGLLRHMPPAEALAAERDDAPRQRRCGLGRDQPLAGRSAPACPPALRL